MSTVTATACSTAGTVKEEAVDFKRNGKLGIIEINYPGTLNSLCKPVKDGLIKKLREADASNINVLVIKGIPRSFSAGGDLSEIGGIRDPIAASEYIMGVSEIMQVIDRMRMVTIALVEGYAVGAGLSLATACDLIYAGDKAKFSMAFLKVGLVPDCGVSYLLASLVGVQKAKELTFTGEIIDAAEALRIGLVNNIFPADEVVEKTMQIAHGLTENAPKAMALAKENLKTALKLGLDGAIAVEARTQGLCICGSEHNEGRQAFFEKRKPKF
ncbi:MAG TPA: enoyl-CoA hydratase-related protein [Syntrophomonas sp.]|nr:enoyl-CoA hydratase-related protein [Syntrophomonas sp.]